MCFTFIEERSAIKNKTEDIEGWSCAKVTRGAGTLPFVSGAINEPDALPRSLTHAKNQGVPDGCDQHLPVTEKYQQLFKLIVK